MTVRTRFAPSPTGFLHIGGLRTALFCWLYARRQAGQFVLRIEDTDLERSTPAAIQQILDGMEWAGLDADEGPFYQTKRFDRYKEVIDELLLAGHAYRCYCTKEELAELRAAADGRVAKSRGTTDAGASATTPVRALRPWCASRIRSRARSSSTTSSMAGWCFRTRARRSHHCALRRHAHLQFLRRGGRHGHADHSCHPRRRSSEQHAAANEHAARAGTNTAGVCAPAHDSGSRWSQTLEAARGGERACNIATMASCPKPCSTIWSAWAGRTATRRFFTLEEMMRLFDIADVNKSASAFNVEKLTWLNQQHMMRAPPARIVPVLRWHLDREGIQATDDAQLEQIVLAQRERAKTCARWRSTACSFSARPRPMMRRRCASTSPRRWCRCCWRGLDDPRAPRGVVGPGDSRGHQTVSPPPRASRSAKLAQPIRLAVCGGTVSPPIDATLAILGKTEALRRDWQERMALWSAVAHSFS